MGLFDRFKKKPTARVPEHAVIVTFSYGNADLGPLFDLGNQIRGAIDEAVAGEYDGDEVEADGSRGTLYMYGPSADALYSAVAPVPRTCPFMAGATVRLRYGPPADDTAKKVFELP